MVRGSLEPLDAQQMRLATHYEGGYAPEHPTIKLFWQYFEQLDSSRQRKVLAFVTGQHLSRRLTTPDPFSM